MTTENQVSEGRGNDAVQTQKEILDAAFTKSADTFAVEQRERLAQEVQRQAEQEQERRYIAALDASSSATLAQARTDMMKYAATVGTAGFAGFLVGGPIGAVLGVAGAWLFDSITGGY